jgi:hypothetical protein
MTFEEFLAKVDSVFNGFSYKNQLRYGQCLMNVLYQSRPDLYETIKGTDFDCFYDNGTVAFTLNHLETTWEKI